MTTRFEHYANRHGSFLSVTQATKPDLAHALKGIRSAGLTFGPFIKTLAGTWRAVARIGE